MFRNLAYCPLDLPLVEVDYDVLNVLIDNYNTGHHDGIWDALPLAGRVSNQESFKSAEEFELAWERRYDATGKVLFNTSVYEILKPIFDQFERIPVNVTHAQILRANKSVPKHHDMKHKGGMFIDDRPDITYEPNGFKIMLSHINEKSFYVSETFDSKEKYITFPENTNTFVINEKTYPHGSDYIEDKCIVSIFGKVDKVKMNELIESSITKFKGHIIEF